MQFALLLLACVAVIMDSANSAVRWVDTDGIVSRSAIRRGGSFLFRNCMCNVRSNTSDGRATFKV